MDRGEGGVEGVEKKRFLKKGEGTVRRVYSSRYTEDAAKKRAEIKQLSQVRCKNNVSALDTDFVRVAQKNDFFTDQKISNCPIPLCDANSQGSDTSNNQYTSITNPKIKDSTEKGQKESKATISVAEDYSQRDNLEKRYKELISQEDIDKAEFEALEHQVLQYVNLNFKIEKFPEKVRCNSENTMDICDNERYNNQREMMKDYEEEQWEKVIKSKETKYKQTLMRESENSKQNRIHSQTSETSLESLAGVKVDSIKVKSRNKKEMEIDSLEGMKINRGSVSLAKPISGLWECDEENANIKDDYIQELVCRASVGKDIAVISEECLKSFVQPKEKNSNKELLNIKRDSETLEKEKKQILEMRNQLKAAEEKFKEEKLAWENKQTEFEHWKKDEKSQIIKERRVLEQQTKAILKFPSKKEREEIEALQAIIERERRDAKVKEANNKQTVERIRQQFQELQTTNLELKEEIKWYEQNYHKESLEKQIQTSPVRETTTVVTSDSGANSKKDELSSTGESSPVRQQQYEYIQHSNHWHMPLENPIYNEPATPPLTGIFDFSQNSQRHGHFEFSNFDAAYLQNFGAQSTDLSLKGYTDATIKNNTRMPNIPNIDVNLMSNGSSGNNMTYLNGNISNMPQSLNHVQTPHFYNQPDFNTNFQYQSIQQDPSQRSFDFANTVPSSFCTPNPNLISAPWHSFSSCRSSLDKELQATAASLSGVRFKETAMAESEQFMNIAAGNGGLREEGLREREQRYCNMVNGDNRSNSVSSISFKSFEQGDMGSEEQFGNGCWKSKKQGGSLKSQQGSCNNRTDNGKNEYNTELFVNKENESCNNKRILKCQSNRSESGSSSNASNKQSDSQVSQSSNLLSTVRSDRVECTLPGGEKAIYFKNGNIKVIHVNSVSTIFFVNSDIKRTFPNSKVEYYYADIDTWQVSYTNGVEVFYFKIGQAEAHHPDNIKEIIFPDGYIKRVYPCGREDDISFEEMSEELKEGKPKMPKTIPPKL